MEKTLPLEERSISNIYIDSPETCVYQIPIYQRNYAWEENEITDLIKDVYDSYKKGGNTPYYIGTLVTFKRGDNIFEVIDGQQRLTTIYLMLKAINEDHIKNELTYTARSASAGTLKNLPLFKDDADQGIRNGFHYVENALNSILGKGELDGFKSYFLHYVKLIHYNVPKDVDLNHYFEVMNSRGEQLEQHEIVKSKLSQKLEGQDLVRFSSVWEACSAMGTYIQKAFHSSGCIIDKNSDFIIKSFSEIPGATSNHGKEPIKNLLNSLDMAQEITDGDDQTDNFQPIIDFPNFLLIVLKLTRLGKEGFMPSSFSLDDKELIKEFDEAIGEAEDDTEFARIFAFNLLKAKYYLDNFVVHHSISEKEHRGDNPWQLQKYHFTDESKHQYPKNLSDDTDIQQELVHLLSMFEVSFTPKQRKNYLFYILAHLFKDHDIDNYLRFLQTLADQYFHDVYLYRGSLNDKNQPLPNAFDNAIISRDGKGLRTDVLSRANAEIFRSIYEEGKSDIPLFVFNYTDYILWKKYATTLRGQKVRKEVDIRKEFFEELGCSDFTLKPFDDFFFSRTRKSLEHYYPQAKAVNKEIPALGEISMKQINCFGNFAMIGAEANSSGSNLDPISKNDRYNDTNTNPISVASLKFLIMMQICEDNKKEMTRGSLDRSNGMEWDFEDMSKHQQKMMAILFRYSD